VCGSRRGGTRIRGLKGDAAAALERVPPQRLCNSRLVEDLVSMFLRGPPASEAELPHVRPGAAVSFGDPASFAATAQVDAFARGGTAGTLGRWISD
jgi:hypothetical protein